MFNTSLNNGSNEKTGTIKAWGGSSAPFGWLICDGSAISRTLYAALFAVIGTTYGVGDGSTTFNLPNGKMPIGTTAPVRGNGKALGLTDGINAFSLRLGIVNQWANADYSYEGYGANFGTDLPGVVTGNAKAVGVTPEVDKSGAVVELTAATAASFAIIKY